MVNQVALCQTCFVAETLKTRRKQAEEMMEESRWFCIFPSDYGLHLEMIGVSSEREDGDVITHFTPTHLPTLSLTHTHTQNQLLHRLESSRPRTPTSTHFYRHTPGPFDD